MNADSDDDWTLEELEEAAKRIPDLLDQREKNAYDWNWNQRARREQRAPDGDWRIWMIMAGRGFGKTRAGAEWVHLIAEAHPQARIALVSASLVEARAVMVEGESGLLSVGSPENRPLFEPSLRRLRFPNGAQAQLFSAAEPETLRGPQHSHARRASPEGILRQRGFVDARRTACAERDSLAVRAANRSSRGRLLPGYCTGKRQLDRGGRPYRGPDRGGVAIRHPCRWLACVRPGGRTIGHLPVGMASRNDHCRTYWRRCRRQRSAGRSERSYRGARNYGCARHVSNLIVTNGGFESVLRSSFYPQAVKSDILATPGSQCLLASRGAKR